MRRRIVVLGLVSLAIMVGAARADGQSALISHDEGGRAGNGDSFRPRASADGLRVVFMSKATNLVPGDTSGREHIYLWDGRAEPARVVRLSVSSGGAPANGPSDNPAISPDGNWVAFNSTATNLGAPPTGGWSSVYVRDLSGGTIYWVSQGLRSEAPNAHCGRPSISDPLVNSLGDPPSPPRVVFECLATNMVDVDRNDSTDVFAVDVSTSPGVRLQPILVSASTGGGPSPALNAGYSQYASISADGAKVAFESYSSNLVAGDANRVPDIFVKNVTNSHLTRITGPGFVESNSTSLRPWISGDGKFVVFESQATNLVIGGSPKGIWHIFRTELASNVTRLVSVDALGAPASSGGLVASTNRDGSRVSYESWEQIFLWEEDSAATRYVSWSDSGVASANGPGTQAALASSSFDRTVVVWSTKASNLDDTEAPGEYDGVTEDADGRTHRAWNVFMRVSQRTVTSVSPKTTAAKTASGSQGTVVHVTGQGIGRSNTAQSVRSAPVAAAAAAQASLPTVMIGTVQASGVSMPDDDTLLFAAPALPAGSSSVAAIRYGDGEVVTLPFALKAMALVPNSTTDTDKDTLADWWELTYGLDPNDATDANTVQSNGLTPIQSLAQQHNPTATAYRHLAEGATGSLFQTRLALANPDVLPAMALLRYLKPDGTVQTQPVSVPAMGRATVDVETVAGMSSAEFSTTVESDLPLIVDRTMRWGGSASYGAHTETAVATPALTWYLAEGATHNAFNLFYLLQNPNGTEAQVRVRYLRPVGDPLEKTYVLGANSRTNIWVDLELFPGLGQALASTDVSAVFEVLNGQPIIVERAMYADVTGQTFGAGHESAGITAPALQWFLAEGATGPYFDLFVLIANPGATLATIQATYLLPDGRTLVKDHVIAPSSRFNIWVDYEDPQLANTAVSTTIRSTNGVPIIVERAMWWPGSAWYEAHNSPGATTAGTRWALAEGEAGGTRGVETYILIANTSDTPATVKVTLLFEDGTNAEQTYPDLPARSRFNVPVGAFFPQAAGKRFGALVESLGTTPARIVVERAMYWDAPGQPWAAGTNALATKLQ